MCKVQRMYVYLVCVSPMKDKLGSARLDPTEHATKSKEMRTTNPTIACRLLSINNRTKDPDQVFFRCIAKSSPFNCDIAMLSCW